MRASIETAQQRSFSLSTFPRPPRQSAVERQGSFVQFAEVNRCENGNGGGIPDHPILGPLLKETLRDFQFFPVPVQIASVWAAY
jgi:hypothetical protein